MRLSVHDCWKAAGGGTKDFDPEDYRDLMTRHGHLVEKPALQSRHRGHHGPERLPCGWRPRRRET